MSVKAAHHPFQCIFTIKSLIKDKQTVKVEILSKLRSEHLKKGKARAEKQLEILQSAMLRGRPILSNKAET